MWFHENLRSLQDDLPIIAEHHQATLFAPLCQKFSEICTINWKRLRIIQNYRLGHFDQLMKSTLDTRRDFLQLFGSSLPTTLNPSVTLLYSHRTRTELARIHEVEERFRTAISLDRNEEEPPKRTDSSQEAQMSWHVDPPATGDHIERDRVFIEVIHDPSRCTANADHPSDNACLVTTDPLLTFSITVEHDEQLRKDS